MKVKEIEIQNKWYPKQLRKINNPPKKLYVLGNHEILNTDSLSIIGSRCCTSYGADMAREFARKLAKKGITIVSGMAKGIDSNAHLGAIEANGRTIAVLGSGFNHIYPDKEIYEKILKSGGTVITEYSENVGVSPQGFRDRNRIVAGLSLGTLVIEAKQRSGTGITANYVKRYKRKLFCIPHEIEDKSGVGTNRLLKKGAILVTEVKDILQYFKTINNEEKTEKANDELRDILGLKKLDRIDLFDNSNLFGSFTVSCMVVFKNGRPAKKEYRKYKISLDKNDDYHTMQEVIYRRYYRALVDKTELPDLIIVDGGINQMNACMEILNSLNLSIRVCGLRKNDKHRTNDLIDSVGYKTVEIDKSSPVFHYLTRMQDEVHRYTISYHRTIRSKGAISSVLDNIEGIGTKRKKELIKTFGSISKIENASIEELSKIIPEATAIRLQEYLKEKDEEKKNK